MNPKLSSRPLKLTLLEGAPSAPLMVSRLMDVLDGRGSRAKFTFEVQTTLFDYRGVGFAVATLNGLPFALTTPERNRSEKLLKKMQRSIVRVAPPPPEPTIVAARPLSITGLEIIEAMPVTKLVEVLVPVPEQRAEQKQVLWLRELVASGMKVAAIAPLFGLSRQRIYQLIWEHRIIRPPKPALPEQICVSCRGLFRSPTKRKTCSMRCLQAAIPQSRRKPLPEWMEQAFLYLREGASYTDAAARAGQADPKWAAANLHLYLARRGIQVPPRKVLCGSCGSENLVERKQRSPRTSCGRCGMVLKLVRRRRAS